MNFYHFNIGDYAGKTRHLSWDEDMAYRRLLDAYYASEAPLPSDRAKIYRLVGAQSKKQKISVDAVLEEFFDECEDGWRNSRCDEEIAKAAEKKTKASQSAKTRWEAEKALREHVEPQSVGSAKAMRTHSEGNAPSPSPSPSPSPNIKDDDAARARRRAIFDEVDHALRAIPELGSYPVVTDAVIAPIFGLVIDKGYDLQTQVLPSIRRQAAKAKAPIKGWNYFVPGIIADATQPTPTAGNANGTARKPTRDETFAAIERRIEQLREAES